MFFVGLAGDRERKFRCSVCGDVFALQGEPDAAGETRQELARKRATAEARQATEPEQR